MNPYITDKNDNYVKKAVEILSKKFNGLKISAGLTVADENITGKFIPVITLGHIGGEAHSSKEWVSKKSVEKMEIVYKDILEKLSED